MKLQPNAASEEHKECYRQLIEVVERFIPKIAPAEMLAITANLTGMLITYQDKRLNNEEITRMVWSNIQSGNKLASVADDARRHTSEGVH